MKHSLILLIGLILGIGHALPVYALEAIPLTAHSTETVAQDKSENTGKTYKKPGFFKQLRMVKSLKKELKHLKTWTEDEKASRLANTALLLFPLSLILMAMASIVGFLVYVGLALLLTSNIISFVVLSTEENKKSRKIAKSILIATLALVLLGVLIFIALYAFLATLFFGLF